MLREPGERSVRPERLIGRRNQQHEQERARHGDQRGEHRDEQAGALQRLQSRRPQLVRRTGDGISAADRRDGEREPQHIDQHGVEGEPARDRRRWRRRSQRRPGDVAARQADEAPHDDARQDADGNPDAACDSVGREIESHPRADPQQPHRDHRHHSREVFRPHEARQAPAADCRERDCRGVLSDDDAGEGREEEAFDEAGGRRGLGRSCPERLMDPGHGSAGDEQRPAFDVDGADERADHGRGQHEPDSRVSERRSRRAGDEKCGNAELRNGERRRLAHRHERQQRRRRQNDANLTTGSMRL